MSSSTPSSLSQFADDSSLSPLATADDDETVPASQPLFDTVPVTGTDPTNPFARVLDEEKLLPIARRAVGRAVAQLPRQRQHDHALEQQAKLAQSVVQLCLSTEKNMLWGEWKRCGGVDGGAIGASCSVHKPLTTETNSCCSDSKQRTVVKKLLSVAMTSIEAELNESTHARAQQLASALDSHHITTPEQRLFHLAVLVQSLEARVASVTAFEQQQQLLSTQAQALDAREAALSAVDKASPCSAAAAQAHTAPTSHPAAEPTPNTTSPPPVAAAPPAESPPSAESIATAAQSLTPIHVEHRHVSGQGLSCLFQAFHCVMSGGLLSQNGGEQMRALTAKLVRGSAEFAERARISLTGSHTSVEQYAKNLVSSDPAVRVVGTGVELELLSAYSDIKLWVLRPDGAINYVGAEHAKHIGILYFTPGATELAIGHYDYIVLQLGGTEFSTIFPASWPPARQERLRIDLRALCAQRQSASLCFRAPSHTGDTNTVSSNHTTGAAGSHPSVLSTSTACASGGRPSAATAISGSAAVSSGGSSGSGCATTSQLDVEALVARVADTIMARLGGVPLSHAASALAAPQPAVQVSYLPQQPKPPAPAPVQQQSRRSPRREQRWSRARDRHHRRPRSGPRRSSAASARTVTMQHNSRSSPQHRLTVTAHLPASPSPRARQQHVACGNDSEDSHWPAQGYPSYAAAQPQVYASPPSSPQSFQQRVWPAWQPQPHPYAWVPSPYGMPAW